MGKQVGLFIRQLREQRGLSQGDVAKLLNLKTAQSISNIERGVSPLPKAKIKRLADVLGVRKSEIVTIVLNEVQDRYQKAAGVQNKAVFIASDLSTEEQDLLKVMAERLRSSKSAERETLRKRLKTLSRPVR